MVSPAEDRAAFVGAAKRAHNNGKAEEDLLKCICEHTVYVVGPIYKWHDLPRGMTFQYDDENDSRFLETHRKGRNRLKTGEMHM